jgi:hypothetical protein
MGYFTEGVVKEVRKIRKRTMFVFQLLTALLLEVLVYDLGYYNSVRYHDFADKINEIGKMTGGWLKSFDAKRPLQ